MAIKSTNLGGTDIAYGNNIDEDNWNDTFDAAVAAMMMFSPYFESKSGNGSTDITLTFTITASTMSLGRAIIMSQANGASAWPGNVYYRVNGGGWNAMGGYGAFGVARLTGLTVGSQNVIEVKVTPAGGNSASLGAAVFGV